MSDTLAFLIHHRAYLENDAILDVFTQRYGLLSVVVKNFHTKSSKSQKLRSCIQLFTLLEIDISYKPASLSVLLSAEVLSVTPPLSSSAFIYASYINEIIRLLMIESDASDTVFLTVQLRVVYELT